MIEVRDLRRVRGDEVVLSGVDLDVERTETLAVMGPNGAGKTTLLKTIAGLQEPDDGTIAIDGGPVGFAPEDPADALFAGSVADEVAYFPRNRDLPVAARVADALSATGIEDLRDRVPQTLSAGEQRLVTIAAVLAGDPSVVALDEPTSSLDRRATTAIGETIEALDRTVLLATHDADVALAYADRVAIVADGGVHTVGGTAAVLGDVTFDFAAVGIEAPAPVAFAREMGWSTPPASPSAAAARLEGADGEDADR